MRDAGPTSTATERAFESIAKALAKKGAEAGKMFGMQCLKANGKAFAGIFGDDLVFKLGGDDHAAAMKLAGAVLFDPSGAGRPMKEWVVVPRAHQKKWPTLAAAAVAYVCG